MTIAAIMQPTYLPWIGYFSMIDRADIFVFLDSVQFNKRSWQQRNRIKGPNGEIMLTVPVLTKGRRDQLIKDVKINYGEKWAEKHLGTIKQNYMKAPFFYDYFSKLETILSSNIESLADMNISIIRMLMSEFGITTETIGSSSLEPSGSKADLLADVCKKTGADVYLSAPGSREYIEQSNSFEREGIELIYHNYEQPEYDQLYGDFLPYMGAVDLLFNAGTESETIIRKGIESDGYK